MMSIYFIYKIIFNPWGQSDFYFFLSNKKTAYLKSLYRCTFMVFYSNGIFYQELSVLHKLYVFWPLSEPVQTLCHMFTLSCDTLLTLVQHSICSLLSFLVRSSVSQSPLILLSWLAKLSFINRELFLGKLDLLLWQEILLFWNLPRLPHWVLRAGCLPGVVKIVNGYGMLLRHVFWRLYWGRYRSYSRTSHQQAPGHWKCYLHGKHFDGLQNLRRICRK